MVEVKYQKEVHWEMWLSEQGPKNHHLCCENELKSWAQCLSSQVKYSLIKDW